jgi:hypothetical protein
MTATVVRLLPAHELALLKAYVEGRKEPSGATAMYEALEVPADVPVSRLSIAVAHILLHHIQETLPQWTAVRDGTVMENRTKHRRHADALLSFSPKLICTINWADSGPGFSWPEAYHVTYLPGFDKFVITASRDGDDMWGCADHAIGVADGILDPIEAAKNVIIEYWRSQVDGPDGWDQSRWAYLFDEGLIDDKAANDWADEVWGPEEQEDMDEEDDTEEEEVA